MKTLTLSEYFVRVRPVPPHARGDVYNVEQAPPFPRQEIKSVAGGSETHDALENSEAAQRWREDMAAFQKRLRARLVSFNYDYGVLDWIARADWTDPEPPGDDASWVAEPSKDWLFPGILVRYGVTPGDIRRVDYIKYEVIQTDADRNMLDNELLGEYEPVTEKEVESALVPFA